MPRAKNVSAAKPKIAGAVFMAPLGTALPTTASAALDAAFEELGYVSEEGLTNSNSPSTENIREWGGTTVLVVASEKPDTFQLTLIETLRVAAAQLVYGADNVTAQDDGDGNIIGFDIAANSAQPENHVFVIDMVLNGGAMKRIVIPDGELSGLGDIAYRNNQAIGYNVTIAALPDGEGNTHKEYIVFGTAGTRYTVTFNSNGGSAVAPQEVAAGGTATQPSAPTKTGFTFAGWFTDTGLTNSFNFSTEIGSNLVLYAKWTS